MLKKILCLCLMLPGMYTLAIPTIAVPDLKFDKQAVAAPDVDNPKVTKTVVNTLPKFTADIRGALITTGQFKVIDVKSMNETKDNAGDLDINQTATALADALQQSKQLDNCASYVIAGMNTQSETTDLIAILASILAKTPDFATKYVNQNTMVSASGVVKADKLNPECQLQVQVNRQEKSFLGSANTSYAVNASLVKGSSVLWQQNTLQDGNTDYYLVGEINYIGENEDSYPIKNTDNMTKQYVVEVGAEFKLVRKQDNAVMAAFTANGSGRDVKIVSTTNLNNRAWHHDIGKIVSAASKDLAANVLSQMQTQFQFTLDNEEKLKKAGEPVVITDVKVYN